MNISPIFWREVKIEFYNIYKFITYFVSPILLFIFFGAIFSINNNMILYQGKTMNYIYYLLPGILTLQIYLLFNKALASVRIDEISNVIKTIAISKTNLVSYYYGKLFANIILTIVRLLILSIFAWIIFGIIFPFKIANLLFALSAIIIGSSIWFSFGFLCGIFILKEETRDFIFSVITFPISFASSIYYNLEQAPSLLRKLSMFNPLTYNCNIIRFAFWGSDSSIIEFDIIVLAITSLLFLVLSLFSLRYLVR